MATNQLENQAMARVVQIPAYIKEVRFDRNIPLLKLAQTIKIIARDQALSYTKTELEKEFGDMKKLRVWLAAKLIKDSLRFKMVTDGDKVLLFANTVRHKTEGV